ncbi:MAG: hypothetical protein OXH38_06780 [Chloroflexi bacterium]|nr:hypothetical protein [Chloroflexota bacterium]
MSAIILGKTSELLLGVSVANKVLFTGELSGTDAISLQEAHSVRPIPGGRGVAGSQQSGFETNTMTLSCDSNSVHDPILRGQNTRRLYFTFRPEGDGTNLPQYIGEAVATISLAASLQPDQCRWQVQLAVDGDAVLSNQ